MIITTDKNTLIDVLLGRTQEIGFIESSARNTVVNLQGNPVGDNKHRKYVMVRNSFTSSVTDYRKSERVLKVMRTPLFVWSVLKGWNVIDIDMGSGEVSGRGMFVDFTASDDDFSRQLNDALMLDAVTARKVVTESNNLLADVLVF